jgi:2-C-methyl-D-erythritol 4-phosphate cytidylyltransferase
VADTVKRAEGDTVVETVDRTGLVAVQTPQAFPADALRRAHASGGDATDCAGLVESAGGRVRIVAGDPRLLKVTTQGDLDFAEALLRAEA